MRALTLISAVGLVLGAVMFGGAQTSEAASLTFTIDGTVTSASGAFSALGIAFPGDHISGSFTIASFNDSVWFGGADPSGAIENVFGQKGMSWSLHVGHPGISDLTLAGSTNAFFNIESIYLPPPHYDFSTIRMAQWEADFSGFVFTDLAVPGQHVLTSLVGFPTSAGGVIALLGGAAPVATGRFIAPNQAGSIEFAFTLAAVTPIPATLPLFASAIGGLGLIGWRRRRDREGNNLLR